MQFFDLFNVPVEADATARVAPGIPIPSGAGGAGSQGAVGTFITPQALATFPLATGVIVGLWKVAQSLGGGWTSQHYVLLICAIVVGTLVFLSTVTDKRVQLRNRLDWTVAVGIAADLSPPLIDDEAQ